MNETAGVTTIDLRGPKRPLPALRARKALSLLYPGAALVVECTDPLAVIDIPNLVRENGDILEGDTNRDDVLIFPHPEARRLKSVAGFGGQVIP